MKFILKYIVLIFCCALLDALKFSCDYRYTPLGWFKYHEIPATWYDARLQCQFEGGTLASPTTAEMKNIMLESFCKPEILTGIHATFSKGNYHSIDGIPLSSIPHEWAPYEPDNKNNAEQCLTLNSDGKFSDVRCEEPRPYICYRRHSKVDVTNCGTPDPEYLFSNQTKKCYKFHTNRRTFKRAQFACSAEGGHLVIINSDEELKFINELYAKYPLSKFLGTFGSTAFIGFHDWDESADWRTLDGHPLQEAGFAKFSPGQPDNATTGEYCGSLLRNGLLNDMLCEIHYPFICEKRPDYPEVCDIASAEDGTKYFRNCDTDIEDDKQSTEEPETEPEIDIRMGPIY
ncbi:unnamed protein product [Arctia plantaginis]|uniref:C-type lectin domain-containing protein n=1 Tax=Arctia plantaginis TaxID=874455 RepID=A0A8S1BKQ9_ARCPL|nr:unnamed protein product [Arctia plantaginis]